MPSLASLANHLGARLNPHQLEPRAATPIELTYIHKLPSWMFYYSAQLSRERAMHSTQQHLIPQLLEREVRDVIALNTSEPLGFSFSTGFTRGGLPHCSSVHAYI